MARVLARFVMARLRGFGRTVFRLVQDTFFVRLVLSVPALWRESRFLAVLLAALLAAASFNAALIALRLFAFVQGAGGGIVWPVIAALFVFLALLELAAAGLTSALRLGFRVSLDLGRHRIGVLLAMAAVLVGVLAVSSLAQGAILSPSRAVPVVALSVALAMVATWFQRAYRRAAYPGFRDFHADLVQARHYLDRAAHG